MKPKLILRMMPENYAPAYLPWGDARNKEYALVDGGWGAVDIVHGLFPKFKKSHFGGTPVIEVGRSYK